MEASKYYVTWEEVRQFIDDFCKEKEGNKYTGVYGIPRGGLILAALLSHKLDTPMLAAPAPGCLIVDDVCDSGESLLHYIKNSSSSDKPKWETVTMYYKENDLVVPKYFWKEVNKDIWLVFPWEYEYMGEK